MQNSFSSILGQHYWLICSLEHPTTYWHRYNSWYTSCYHWTTTCHHPARLLQCISGFHWHHTCYESDVSRKAHIWI